MPEQKGVEPGWKRCYRQADGGRQWQVGAEERWMV